MRDVIRLADHAQCHALAGFFGGRLCEVLAANRPGRRFRGGEFLYLTGDPAHSTYYVRSGLVKTGLTSADGDEITLRLHKAGEFVGESCHCTGERREHARAMEDSTIVELPFADFVAHLQHNPRAGNVRPVPDDAAPRRVAASALLPRRQRGHTSGRRGAL